jgi:hypothetical protein
MPHVIAIREPVRQFLLACSNVYGLGASEAYQQAISTATNKYCFNPYFSSECDVQVKLGGLIEAYFRQYHFPFTVCSEQKIYPGDNNRNNKADLTIYRIVPGALHTSREIVRQSLVAVMEIKYANAVHPNYEFARNLIMADLEKLSLISQIQRYFVLLDEADRVGEQHIRWLVNECRQRHIQLISNNRLANRLLSFPYGYNELLWLSRQVDLSNKDYIFLGTNEFKAAIPNEYELIDDDGYIMTLGIGTFVISLCYDHEYNEDRQQLHGHLSAEIHAASALSEKDVLEAITPLAAALGCFVFIVEGPIERKLYEPGNPSC